jgi:hypothetical protein
MTVIVIGEGLLRSVHTNRKGKVIVFDYDGEDLEQIERDEQEAKRLIRKFKLKKIS